MRLEPELCSTRTGREARVTRKAEILEQALATTTVPKNFSTQFAADIIKRELSSPLHPLSTSQVLRSGWMLPPHSNTWKKHSSQTLSSKLLASKLSFFVHFHTCKKFRSPLCKSFIKTAAKMEKLRTFVNKKLGYRSIFGI